MDGEIDFSKYSLQQLREAEAGIRKDLFPINYANLLAELHQRGLVATPERTVRPRIPVSKALLRDRFRRVFVGFLWFLFFWYGVGAIAAGIAASRAANVQDDATFQEGLAAGKEYGLQFGRRYGPWFFWGGLLLATFGTAFQVLPGTKRRVAPTREAQGAR